MVTLQNSPVSAPHQRLPATSRLLSAPPSSVACYAVPQRAQSVRPARLGGSGQERGDRLVPAQCRPCAQIRRPDSRLGGLPVACLTRSCCCCCCSALVERGDGGCVCLCSLHSRYAYQPCFLVDHFFRQQKESLALGLTYLLLGLRCLRTQWFR